MFHILRQLSNENFVSGEALANRLGISRASVHNAVREAQSCGLEIHSVRGRGYRLAQPHSWLDAEQTERVIAPLGYRLHIHDEVDSTNSRLMALGQAGAEHKTVLAAESQTGGKGRRGRVWLSPLGGGLVFSVLWRFNRPASELSCLSLAVGLGVSRALKQMGADDISLKWPNDILLKGRKLAGMLIELQGDALGPTMAVIGVGVNVHLSDTVRSEIDQPAAGLSDTLREPTDRNALLAACLTQLHAVLGQFERDGFAGLKAEWDAGHAFHGRDVQMISAQGENWQGRVAGIGDDGALLLDTAHGPRRFYSGEMSLRGAAK